MLELMRFDGIWFPGNGSRKYWSGWAGSRRVENGLYICVGQLLSSPASCAAVGTFRGTLLVCEKRNPWYAPKKKVLFLPLYSFPSQNGPPTAPPNSFWLKGVLGVPCGTK